MDDLQLFQVANLFPLENKVLETYLIDSMVIWYVLQYVIINELACWTADC